MTALPASVVYDDHDGAAEYAERRRQWEMMHVYGLQYLEFTGRTKQGYPNFAKGPCSSCGAFTAIFILFAKNKNWSLCTHCAADEKAGDYARSFVNKTCGVGTSEQSARDFRAMLDDTLGAFRRRTA